MKAHRDVLKCRGQQNVRADFFRKNACISIEIRTFA